MQIFFWHFWQTSDVVFGLTREESVCVIRSSQRSQKEVLNVLCTSEVLEFTPSWDTETLYEEENPVAVNQSVSINEVYTQ